VLALARASTFIRAPSFILMSKSDVKPLCKLYGKPIESWFPISDGHGPFPGNIVHSQVDHFVDHLIGGKNAMIARNLTQRHIDGLNGSGRIDNLANVF
jgi:hypothetical protein